MRYKLPLIYFSFLFFTTSIFAQESNTIDNTVLVMQDTIVKETKPKAAGPIKYKSGDTFELGGMTVTGLEKFSEQAVKVFTGLKVGQQIKIPGDKLSSAIKKLYEQKQFSNVDVYISKIDGKVVYLEFDVKELPQLNNITFSGVKKGKAKELKKDTELIKGAMLTDNLLVTSQNYIKSKYQEKGFLNAKVRLDTKKDTADVNSLDMLVHVDKGNKIKIKDIYFDGNDKVKDKTLAKAMKNTKKKKFGRFWKGSKFIDEKFDEDLQSILDKFSEKGHRDARILNDSISWNDDNTINVHIVLEEGQKYYFGGIEYIGNVAYSDARLNSILRIDKGQVYNAKVLKERVLGDGTPESQDIKSLYDNYFFIGISFTFLSF